MLTKFELQVILKFLFPRNNFFICVINYLSTIGIAIGVMTLVIVMSVMNGLEKELFKRMISVNGNYTITNNERSIINYSKIINKLEELPFIIKAIPKVNGQVLIQKSNKIIGVLIKGIEIDYLIGKLLIKNSMVRNVFFDQSENSAYIGLEIANQLNVKIGDKINIIIPKINVSMLEFTLKTKIFIVAGIFDTGMYEYNDLLLYIPILTAKSLISDKVSEIEIIIKNFNYTKNYLMQVNDLLMKEFTQNLFAYNWINDTFFKVLKIEKNVMFFVLLFIIFIAAFNIFSSLIMLVKDKYQSIIIFRSLGITKTSITKIFAFVGFALGLFGTTVGTIIGFIFLFNINNIKDIFNFMPNFNTFSFIIYILTYLPNEIKVNETIMISFLTLLISLLATIYPSLKASNSKITESL